MSFTEDRKALGAGRWFDANPQRLKAQVESFFRQADEELAPRQAELGTTRAVGVIAPHAGYDYSGPVAACSLAALRANAAATGGAPDVVVVVGFAHSESFAGAAVLDGRSLATPLGRAPIAVDVARAMCAMPEGRGLLRARWGPHRGEHSAENEVPFVQAAFPGAALVVVLLGEHRAATVDAVAAVLQRVREMHPRLYVVASSDMLHDSDWDAVRRGDAATLRLVARPADHALVRRAWSPDHQVFCGIGPVLVLMRTAELAGATHGIVLHYENSGDRDPASRHDWVVGYSSVIFL